MVRFAASFFKWFSLTASIAATCFLHAIRANHTSRLQNHMSTRWRAARTPCGRWQCSSNAAAADLSDERLPRFFNVLIEFRPELPLQFSLESWQLIRSHYVT